MRLYVVLLFATWEIAAALSPEEVKQLRLQNLKSIEDCAKENNVSDEDVHKIKFTTASNAELPHGRNIECLLACHMKNLNLLNADGTMNYPKIINHKQSLVNDPKEVDKIKEAAEICIKRDRTGEKDLCEFVHRDLQCYYEKARQMNIKPNGLI